MRVRVLAFLILVSASRWAAADPLPAMPCTEGWQCPHDFPICGPARQCVAKVPAPKQDYTAKQINAATLPAGEQKADEQAQQLGRSQGRPVAGGDTGDQGGPRLAG